MTIKIEFQKPRKMTATIKTQRKKTAVTSSRYKQHFPSHLYFK